MNQFTNQGLVYARPADVSVRAMGSRTLISFPQGGSIALDAQVFYLWDYSCGRSLDDILEHFSAQGLALSTIRASLACLAEAGLLERLTTAEQEPVIPEQQHPSLGSTVSVILVSYNSRSWLEPCLQSIFSQTHTPLEIIVVDNGSSDGTPDWLATAYPGVQCLQLDAVHSLAGALNAGVAMASGEYYLLLNPDVKLDSQAICRLVRRAANHSNSAAVCAKLRFLWLPPFLNGLGNYVGRLSWGTDIALGHLDLGQYDHWEQVPSGCFAALLIPARRWETVGPADKGYPMYYEDTDWCYRARLGGLEINVAPDAVVYHASGSSPDAYAQAGRSPKKVADVIYGRLRFVSKIVERPGQFFVLYVIEDILNAIRYLLNGQWEHAIAVWEGWQHFKRDWQDIRALRQILQDRRIQTDAQLFALHRQVPPSLIWHGFPELTWDVIATQYEPLMFERKTRPMPEFDTNMDRPRLLVVSNDIVDHKMAGPGVRYFELAKILKEDINVTLAIPNQPSLEVPGIRLETYNPDDPRSLGRLLDQADILLISAPVLQKFPKLSEFGGRIVVDLYDPIIFENIHYYLDGPLQSQVALNQQVVELGNRLLRIGDYFLCGNQRQRDFWLGMLAANGRINPLTYRQDPELCKLIDIVGIGIPEDVPQVKPVLRGVLPGIEENARIVLWGGGLWDWLDPLSLVRAWPLILAHYPDARLVFLGTRHPNPNVPQQKIVKEVISLSEQMGLRNRTVFFIDWLSYEDHASALVEADVGVSLHPIHIETRFSIRKRVLDYMWARLPVVVTEGDVVSEWINSYHLGRTVPPMDSVAVSEALIAVLSRPKQAWYVGFDDLATQLHWKQVAEPLHRFCLEGKKADDHPVLAKGMPDTNRPNWNNLYYRAVYILKNQGLRMLLHRMWRYFQWRLAQFH